MCLQAVCCPDKEHCCPQGYTCDILSRSCQKLIMMQLERVPLTPVYLLEPQPQLSPTKHKDITCDEQTNCGHDETCCRTSATSWGCCPSSNVWFTETSPASFLLLYVNCQGELRTVSKPRAPKFSYAYLRKGRLHLLTAFRLTAILGSLLESPVLGQQMKVILFYSQSSISSFCTIYSNSLDFSSVLQWNYNALHS